MKLTIIFAFLIGISAPVWAQGIHNPQATYASFGDSPFVGISFSQGYFYLADFEGGLFGTPGVSKSGGSVLLRNDDFSDSVDGDDGTIDNNGNTGGATTGALYSAGSHSIEFCFNAQLLGGRLPTHVGLVVTDALTDTGMTLSAFRSGTLLGSIAGSQISELMHFTAQDRFYGWIDLHGIDRVVITAETEPDWAMDHLQYGAVDSVPPTLMCPPVVLVVDSKGGSPGELAFFDVSATDAQDPAPLVACVPPSGSFFPRGTTIVTCTATDASGNQSVCTFPVVVMPTIRQGTL